MTAAAILDAFVAALGAQAPALTVLGFGLAATAWCSMACFAKRWLRAFIAGGLALEAFMVLCAGWL